MRKKLVLMIIMLTFLAGCGGGSTTPEIPRDLSGLEGTWSLNVICKGTLTNNVNDKWFDSQLEDVTFTISNTLIYDNDDRALWDWEYDGSVLILNCPWTLGFPDTVCGGCYIPGDGVADFIIKVNIEPHSTNGTISGNTNLILATEDCGRLHGTVAMSGTMTKE